MNTEFLMSGYTFERKVVFEAQQETATVGGQNGLGLEEAEAMDMER